MHREWIGRIVVATVVAAIVTTARASAADDISGHFTGGIQGYQVIAGDTWRSVSARFGVDEATLAHDNGLRPTKPLHAGDVLTIDNRHIVPNAATTSRSVIVNVPQRRVFFANAEGQVVGFPVAVGRPGWPTPIQPFRIISRERDPSWEVPESILEEARRAGKRLAPVVPPGPDNPLGKYWLGLSIGDVGIHGTNAPTSIYRAATHGCIRVHPDDIAWLFEHVETGTAGATIYEPVLITTLGQDVFVEAHRDVYGKQRDAEAMLRNRAEELGIVERIDWSAVRETLRAREGIARVVTKPVGSQ